MINKSTQQALLEKILASQEFSASKIYQSYLTYLVNATDEGRVLKEITIAIDVFGKDADFNPAEDTIVRTHTYSLRKKLDSYYFTEGKHDRYRLKIPKGHYEARFFPKPDKWLTLTNFKRFAPWLISLLCLLVIASFWIKNQQLQDQIHSYRQVDPQDPFWKEFVRSDFPVMVVPGDHVFYTININNFDRELAVRDYRINSPEELDSMKSIYPELNIGKSDEPYFPYHSIWSIPPILNMLYSGNQKPLFRKASDISPQILDEYNFIFIGSIKTLYIFKHTMAKSHFSFAIAPHVISYTNPDNNQKINFTTKSHSKGPNEDLVLALKLPGPVENRIFIIASYHSIGAPEIADYLTSSDKRSPLEKLFKDKYGQIPEYFEVLFRVTGIDKTAYNSQILVCNKISGGE